MRIMVTGGSGGLATEIPKVLEQDELTLLGRSGLDVVDAEAVTRTVGQLKPDAIIHSAAYTAVDKAEKEPDRAMAVNRDGTKNIADAAKAVGAILIYPSTDYVFDGRKGSPYVEGDEPRPLSAYGRSKLAGEEVARNNPKTFVVRTSWLYSHRGKSFVTTMLKLFSERDEVFVVKDEVSSPTYARDFARALRDLIITEKYGTYHANCEGEASWFEFAQEIARQSGAKTKVKATTAADYGAPAKRPSYSKLNGGKLAKLGITLPDWKESLKNFFKNR